MPSGQDQAVLLPHGQYSHPECETTILPNAKTQFQYKIRDPEDGSATYADHPFLWQSDQIETGIPENKDSRMSESHLHYYPDHGSTLSDYLQEGIPEVQESYSMSYQTSTSTNGHGDGDASSNNSQSSVPVDNASLIARSTSQTKTQQVKTVTKIIKTREVHHVGPDGTPIRGETYSSYSATLPSNPTNAHEYGTYDPGRPPSPAGQTPVFSHDDNYGPAYGWTASPAGGTLGRNFDIYSQSQPKGQTKYSDYTYRDYPQTVTGAPSGASDSPNLHRAMPQAPRSVVSDYQNHPPGNYEDIDAHSATLVPPTRLDYCRTPSPTQSSDRYGNYGYSGIPSQGPLSATSPGYHQYDPGLPQGYLDRRPSYDERPLSLPRDTRTPQGQHPNATYGLTQRPGPPYDETSVPLPNDGTSPHPAPLRHPHMDYPAVDSQDVRWRDPDLHEVIEFLGHPNSVIKANAAAYLQHLTYMDDNMKKKTRSLGAIPHLIELLNQDIPEIQRNACGALRNLSYGRQNDENKRAIRDAEGIPALVRLLRKTPDNEIRELVTGILWNLSSCDDLKRPIIDDALNVLVQHVIIPNSGWDRSKSPLEPIKSHDIFWPIVFRNASGVLRNVSSAGEYARKKLRSCEGLIEAMVYLVRAAIFKNDMDNRSVENCICVLRNLSYRCQEIEDPDYDKQQYPPVQSRASVPLRAVGENFGCFGTNKKKKEAQEREAGRASMSDKHKRDGVVPLTKNPINQTDPVGGVTLLWQPEVVQCYLSLLVECSNCETLEAAAGAIQNLAACYWQPSIDIRACIRKEKGLPVLVELLKMDVDRVVCAVATALRNLALDSRNKDLIGNYALKDLVLKLPNGSPQHDAGISDDTIAAVLATLNEVVAKNSDFARALLQIGGIERLNQITQQKDSYSPRVVKFASQLLFNMYQHSELREAYKKAGFKESHFFVSKSTAVRNSLSSPTPPGANSTINRPVSTQGGTKYEERDRGLSLSLPHGGTELNSNAASIPYSRSEELPLSELGDSAEPPSSLSQVHRPHMGVFPPGMQHQARSSEPVYAQVKKKGRNDIPVQLLANEQPDGMPAGDSWV